MGKWTWREAWDDMPGPAGSKGTASFRYTSAMLRTRNLEGISRRHASFHSASAIYNCQTGRMGDRLALGTKYELLIYESYGLWDMEKCLGPNISAWWGGMRSRAISVGYTSGHDIHHTISFIHTNCIRVRYPCPCRFIYV